MALQLEKRDELPRGRLTVKAYKNPLPSAQGTSYGRVQSPSDRVNLSNLTASIADRNPGIQPAMISFVARLLHEEIVRQLREGKNVEILGLGTAYVATKGSMKGLNPNVADVPKMTLKFKTSQGIKQQMQGMSAQLLVPVQVKPVINTVFDLKLKKMNETKGGSIIQIKGKHLRVEGNKNEVGLFLIKSDGAKAKMPVDSILRNDPSTLLVSLPQNLAQGQYFIEVVNQSKIKDKFSNSVRVGVSEFRIEVKS